METRYHKDSEYCVDSKRDQNDHIPEWAKYLIRLYRSPLKYKIKYEMEKADKYDCG